MISLQRIGIRLVFCLAISLWFQGCFERERFEPPVIPPGDYQRLVSLTPSVTEILFALGVEDRIRGVTSWCDYPPEVQGLPRVGDFLKPNLEAVLDLEPDLIILAPTGTLLRKSYENFTSLGHRVLVVWNNTLEETFEAILTIGRTLQEESAGQALVKRLRDDLRGEEERLRGSPRKRVLWVVGHRPLIAVGHGTYQSELLERAGGINILDRTADAWPAINEEFVIQADPDVILDSAMGSETGPSPWDRLSSVKAVREKQVIKMSHDALYRPGPRLIEALREIGKALHPERYKADA